jgi:hypothetical protein
MKSIRLTIAAFIALFLLTSSPNAHAAANNTFSGSLLLGDSFAPTNFRLSFGSFDLGFNDIASLYAGTRVWKGSYYAGFGFGAEGAMYGLVGYEWRFLSWMAMSSEFNGMMSMSGEAAGRVYIGLTVGW